MRYLETLPEKIKIGKIIFVAGWFNLKNMESKEEKRIAKPWLTKPINFLKIRKKTNNITVFLSSNEPYGCVKENERKFKDALNANVIIEKNKGHFTPEYGITEVPEVLNEILKH
jgi:predicted alpha/beta hydrolase family esterase